ncbi:tRNA 5-methylaminomethyl-2-thiouridine biosynthesis bifunctional protein [Alteromonadaceae bacterium Bs31]|nr:tRNA 5-methylaminomethyl-2-thiouridine biosynthesis bifunctional protein [Alteromonadaceae bacterium Bs31]
MNEGEATRPNAELIWDENNQPLSPQFDDVYFSRSSGLEETRHVFLRHNHLYQRWSKALNNKTFTIAETGFGTGLNFLASWAQWCLSSVKSKEGEAAKLHFISVEKFPLVKADLEKTLALWPQLHNFSQQLLEHYPAQPAEGCHRLYFENGHVYLTLYFGDAAEGFSQFLPQNSEATLNTSCHTLGLNKLFVDAWYLDGFAPAKNPAMWSSSLFRTMALLSNKSSTFATFTAAGAVRRGLMEAGFDIEKVPGFGRKREMLRGQFKQQNKRDKTETSRGLFWHLQPDRKRTKPIQTALVIGGGLAGCHAAFALAKRGIKVSLLEKNQQLASEASGNRQGVLYTKLSPHAGALNKFNLAAQIYASHFYHTHTLDSEALIKKCGNDCGVLHLASKDKQQQGYRDLAQRYSKTENFCQWRDREQASEVAGVTLKLPGLFVANAGWIAPQKLCEALCRHANIEVLTQCDVAAINADEHWHALDSGGKSYAQADVAIVANARDALTFQQTQYLPLRRIRGQVSHLPAPGALATLKTVLCGEGYIAPPEHGQLCLGASFNLNDENVELTARDQEHNLANLASMLEQDITHLSQHPLEGRVGFRTTTPDYFPIAGPVCNSAQLLQQFDQLRFNASSNIAACSPAIPGLFTLLGLGSRGIAYAPLAAEILASLIAGEALPVDQQLFLHVHPSRFLIRDLSRNKKTSTL